MSKTAEYFRYLDDLRETGATNMYGAGQWLESAFDLDRKQAKEILIGWMKTFDPDKTPEDRAAMFAERGKP